VLEYSETGKDFYRSLNPVTLINNLIRCWIINEKGYATIIPSLGDRVYGLIYELSVKDEESLDKYEKVPDNYLKKVIPIELITSSSNGEVTIDTLVYTDVVRIKRGSPKTEYIHRMNMAIKDALEKDISLSYIDTYLRPFIPPE
jgi:gamma-glutamylcyclotransferase